MTHAPLPWWNESGVLHASDGQGGAIHPARCEREEDAAFIERAVNSHAGLLAALERCQQIAIDRIRTADSAVKKDIYAADALMGIAKTAKDAIATTKGEKA